MKRGINLGCGKIALPCERPDHHRLVPEHLYTDPDIQWDNADWNAGESVNLVVDLFDYPWGVTVPGRRRDGVSELEHRVNIPDNTYDYAIASHIAEHIPHHIVERGQFVAKHPLYQDGWFAWFSELWRIMKPGGTAYILVPYAWSNAGISDPTHTRYLTPASFGYFDAPTNGSPFEYRMTAQWRTDMNNIAITPHNLGLKYAEARTQMGVPDAERDLYTAVWNLAQSNVNMIVEFCVTMEAVKDAD